MAPSDPAPKALDRYELIERIAVGGMAEVFRAKASGAHGFEKVLAIKRILPDLARDQEFEARFIGEAKLAVALTHANIVQVLDFGRFGGSLYIAMEYVDGLDLAALLRALAEAGRPPPVNAALQIALEIAKGLDFAHQRGVVHRDVSPSNILLSRAGEVKIADFGIALAADTGPGLSGVRRIMGKWRYMSPEQARGERLDARSDLFSLGALLFELFTGKKLFPGEEIDDVVENVRSMPIPPASSVRPELPPGLDAALARCLERAPASRWRSASELYRALLDVSYQRTLMVSADDVADLVREVLPARAGGAGAAGGPGATPTRAGGGLIDDIIRSELLAGARDDGGSVSRVTAQATPPPMAFTATDPARAPSPAASGTGSAFVRKGAGPDGVTVWEVIAESKTPSTEAVPDPERTVVDSGKAPPAALAEPPPPEPTPPLGLEAEPPPPRGRRALLWTLSVGLAAAAIAATVWLPGGGQRRSDEPAAPAALALADAAAAPAALLEVVTEPAGARIVVDGQPWPDPTPATVTLASAAGDRHRLELSLPGHRLLVDDGIVVRAGEKLRYVRPLSPMTAPLTVRTTPAGAEVFLDDRLLGRTPLSLPAVLVGADANHRLRLVLDGHKPIDEPITLADGVETRVERELEPEVRLGRVDLIIEPWAYVYFGNRQVADGSVRGLELPVGKQKLRLVNPVLKVERVVTVDVPQKGVGRARFQLGAP